jgi:hypothetical protein
MTHEAGNEKGARRGRRPKTTPELPNLAHKLRAVVRHALPDFSKWLGNMPDTRNALRICYPVGTVLWTGILALLCGARSRRDFGAASATPAYLANLNRLTGSVQEAVPHPDTLVYLMERLSSEALATLSTKCVHTLMRNRVLDKGRVRGHYLIAIDGTGVLSFGDRHCATCLTQKHENGRVTYYHTVLEAKLVTPDGLAFSVGSEFVENADPNASKQDCELKALYRLLPRLKAQFPRTRICVLLDSLYVNDQVLKLCEKHGWRYMITFKEGAAPAAYADFQTLLRLQKENRLTVNRGKETQHLAWVTGLSWQGRHPNVLQCLVKRNTGAETRFVWLTNLELTPRNVETIANDGGRCRWKIENQGFNAQKNGEFHIEHPFGCQGQAWKNFYLLAQVAHLLQQLLYRWRALRVVRQYLGAVYRFIQKIAYDMRTLMPPDEDTVEPAFQLRLDTS